ncbi:MAG TPA: hypothetical protein VFT74_21080 [Isosphaeraceae bacterium]|nr:hypothetical protein [Isosphaeraceae bacterium]
MNDFTNEVLASRIDRLVDGELADFERRALLLELDTQPAGWRRCALAFLEAQEWRTALRASSAMPSVPEPRLMPSKPNRPKSSTLWLARAAAVLMAFGLGWSMSSRLEQDAPPVAGSRPEKPESPPERIETPQPESALARNEAPEPPGESDFPQSPPQTILPRPVVGELQRAGYEVEPQRGFMPVRLSDGSIVDLPVEGVQIRQVSRRTL